MGLRSLAWLAVAYHLAFFCTYQSSFRHRFAGASLAGVIVFP